MFIFQIGLSVLLLACLLSFTWATQKFFIKPENLTIGLGITLLAGAAFGVLHLVTILQSNELPVERAVTAGALYCLSLFIFWSAIRAHAKKPLAACFSPDEEIHLVQHGPYRFIRHPFYTSYLLTWLAGAVATLNVWVGLTFVAMLTLYIVAAVKEENKFADSSLADSYHRYCCSTGRFLPSAVNLLVNRNQ